MLTHPIVKLRRDQVVQLFYEDKEVFRICSDTTALCVEVLCIMSVRQARWARGGRKLMGVRLTHTEADEERKIDCAGNKWLLYLNCTNGDSHYPKLAKPKRANQPHQQNSFSIWPST